MASKTKSKTAVHDIARSIRKMTISPEKAAIGKITTNPEQYIAAFNILLRAWINANIRSFDDHAMLLICDELLSYEMPPDFMRWYFHKHAISNFNKFNMFREQHGDKIKAIAVIQQSHRSVPVATGTAYRRNMSAIAAASAFGPQGGRKKRTQHRRMRRTRIIRTRRHRAQNRNPRK